MLVVQMVYILFGDAYKICQIAKLKSLANKPCMYYCSSCLQAVHNYVFIIISVFYVHMGVHMQLLTWFSTIHT